MCKCRTILYKGREQPQIWGSVGRLEPIPMDTEHMHNICCAQSWGRGAGGCQDSILPGKKGREAVLGGPWDSPQRRAWHFKGKQRLAGRNSTEHMDVPVIRHQPTRSSALAPNLDVAAPLRGEETEAEAPTMQWSPRPRSSQVYTQHVSRGLFPPLHSRSFGRFLSVRSHHIFIPVSRLQHLWRRETVNKRAAERRQKKVQKQVCRAPAVCQVLHRSVGVSQEPQSAFGHYNEMPEVINV